MAIITDATRWTALPNGSDGLQVIDIIVDRPEGGHVAGVTGFQAHGEACADTWAHANLIEEINAAIRTATATAPSPLPVPTPSALSWKGPRHVPIRPTGHGPAPPCSPATAIELHLLEIDASGLHPPGRMATVLAHGRKG